MRKKYPRVLLALGWYDHRLYQGIAKYALQAGWHLCADMTKEKVIPWGWEGDGILAWLGAGEDLAKFVVETKLPTVDFSYRRPNFLFARVLTDHFASAQLVAEHFLRARIHALHVLQRAGELGVRGRRESVRGNSQSAPGTIARGFAGINPRRSPPVICNGKTSGAGSRRN